MTERGPGNNQRPLMIYDGDCGFCTYWAHRWAEKLSPHLHIVALQDKTGRPAQLAVRDLEEEIHLVDSRGDVFRGAAAVFRALALRRRYSLGWWCYRFVPGFRPITEWVYRWVADNRQKVSRWTRWMRRKA